MHNNLTIYDRVAASWWSDDIRCVRTMKNLVPSRLLWFDRQIDWQGCDVQDLGCAGGFMAEALALRGARVTGIDHRLVISSGLGEPVSLGTKSTS
jgi:2-polyprenyl-6-hydroxyphenyl methylase/3-demethylubiquinone-9 3-methyltransferase